jgi:hypothetical protein
LFATCGCTESSALREIDDPGRATWNRLDGDFDRGRLQELKSTGGTACCGTLLQ